MRPDRGPDGLRTTLLAAPLVLLVLAAVVVPLGSLLWRGLHDPSVPEALPRTVAALRGWDGAGLPDDAAFEALAADLVAWRSAPPGIGARAAARLGADIPALREALEVTAARAGDTITPRPVAILLADPAWEGVESWRAIRRAGEGASGFHPLAALGFRQAPGGLEDNAAGPHARAALARGTGAAALAVLLSLPLAWPIARRIAEAPPDRAALWSLLTLLPLLAGEAARAFGWRPLMGEGAGGWLLASVLGALPLMALPVAIALRRAGPRLPRAAAALGASPWMLFRRVRWPLARRGVAVGAALVLVRTIGDFALPAVLAPEGATGATLLADAARSGNWGLSGGLAFWLIPCVLPAAILLRRGMRG